MTFVGKEKKKCNSQNPCSRCIISSSQCLYSCLTRDDNAPIFTSNSDETRALKRIEDSLDVLSKASSTNSELLKTKVSELKRLLTDIPDLLTTKLDSKQIDQTNGGASVETILSRDKKLIPNALCEIQQSDKKGPLVSKYFGLYSPLMVFSQRGINWMITKLLSISASDSTKGALMLFLKYLDANSTQSEDEKRASDLNPLEAYAYFRNIPLQGIELSNFLLGQMEKELEGRDLEAVIKSLEKLHKAYYQENLNLEEFLEKDYLLSSLCYQWYQKEHLSMSLNRKPIDMFVSLVRSRYYADGVWLIGDIITTSCRKAIDIGLNRWEYYVGENEKDAEQSRELWLQCYWWDKWYALMTGKQPLIYVGLCSCLPPKNLMNIGVSYSMTACSLVDAVNPDEIEQNLCYLALSRIIDDVFHNILYNDKFVGISNAGEKLDSFLTEISNTRGELFSLYKKMHENEDAQELLFHLKFAVITIFGYLSDLIIRFGNYSDVESDGRLLKELEILREERAAMCRDTLKQVIKVSTGPLVLKSVLYTLLIMFCMMTLCLNSQSRTTDLSLMLAVSNIYAHVIENPRTSPGDPPFKIALTRYTKMMLILTRICYEFHMQNTSADKLKLELEESLPSSSEHLISNDGIWFEDLLYCGRTSEFRESVLSHLGMNISDFSTRERSDRIDDNFTGFENVYNDDFFSEFLNILDLM